MERQRRFTAEFSKTFSKVISQIINEYFENSPFRRKLGQKGKVFKNNPFTGYFWVCTGSQSSETQLSSHFQLVHILSVYCAGTDIYTTNINRKRREGFRVW